MASRPDYDAKYADKVITISYEKYNTKPYESHNNKRFSFNIGTSATSTSHCSATVDWFVASLS